MNSNPQSPLHQHTSLRLGADDSQSDVIDLTELLMPLWYHRWQILGATIVVTILAIFIVSQIEPTYKASVTLKVEKAKAQLVSVEELYGLDNSKDYLNTQLEVIKSRPVAEKVVRELNLVKHKEFDPSLNSSTGGIKATVLGWFISNNANLTENSPLNQYEQGSTFTKWKDQLLLEMIAPEKEMTDSEIFEKVVTEFLERVSVTPIKKTQVVNISVEMHDPHTAALAANKLGQAYMDYLLESAVAESTNASQWMESRLITLKDKLSISKNKLQSFLAEKGLIDVNGVFSFSSDELTELNEQLINAKSARSEAENKYIQVRDTQARGWQGLLSLPAVLSHPVINRAIDQENDAQRNLNELAEKYSPRHPVMQSAQNELAVAKQTLKEKVLQVASGFKKDYLVARKNEEALQKEVWAKEGQIKQVSGVEFQLNELKKDVESNQLLYDTFLKRFKETTATSDIQMDVKVQYLNKALVPDIPVKPKKKIIVVIAAFLSFIFASGVVLLLRALNNTFTSAQAVESKLNLPVMGVLPLVELDKKTNHRKSLVHLYEDKDNRSYSESVNTLRSSVLLSSLKHNYKVIVVTSSIPGEGKTTTSTNLAYAISHTEKTLFIEADMRRPNVARGLGLAIGANGLADLLAGNADIDECIYQVDGLSVMPAGNVPPNPLELLMSDRFNKALERVKEQYTRIIIDSPPIQAVSDALILGRTADKVIYVVKSESTSIKTVTKGIGQLLQNNAPVKGIVLNQVDIEKSAKYGNYYEGYYDYYGYSNK